jgi:hypothetical protein
MRSPLIRLRNQFLYFLNYHNDFIHNFYQLSLFYIDNFQNNFYLSTKVNQNQFSLKALNYKYQINQKA